VFKQAGPANPACLNTDRPLSPARQHPFPFHSHRLLRINQIETRFGIITRQSIRRSTFTSVKALLNRIRAYINHFNTNAEPFVWTATADEILAKVRIVQTNIRKLDENNTTEPWTNQTNLGALRWP